MEQQMKEMKESLLKIEGRLSKPKQALHFVVHSRETQTVTTFSPAIEFDGNFEIALLNLETYYSFPNIDSSNNTLRIYNGTAWTTIQIPEGSYELENINDYVQKQLGNENVSLLPNTNTLKAVIVVGDGHRVDLSAANSLASVLGFERRIFEAGTFESTGLVNIMNVSSIKVICSGIANSFSNGVRDNVIYSFFPDADVGAKIVERPFQPTYLPVACKRMEDFYVSLVDQNDKPLNLRGEEWSARFHIKEV